MDRRNSPDDLKKRPQKGSQQITPRESGNIQRRAPKQMEFDPERDIASNSKTTSVDLMSRSTKAKKKKANKKLLVTNIVLSVLLVLSSIMFVGATFLDSRLLKKSNIDQEENGKFESVIESPNENVSYFLVCGVDLSENLTDVIMVVCYDLANNQASILQIPRDTFITSDDGRANASNKVNAIYGNARKGESKIKALMRCINSKFGLPIDHYATITIKGTEKVIDIAGGVDITLERSITLIDDTTKPQQKKTFEAGDVHLDGQWGTAFIRHRSSYAQGDLGREKAQRSFYAAFLKKMISMDFGQITSVVTNAANEVSTDLTLGQMLGYAQKMKDLKLSDVQIFSVPGQGCYYNGYSFYSVHKSELVTMINDHFLPYDEDGVKSSDLGITELHSSFSDGYDSFLQGGDLSEFDTKAEKTTAKSEE